MCLLSEAQLRTWQQLDGRRAQRMSLVSTRMAILCIFAKKTNLLEIEDTDGEDEVHLFNVGFFKLYSNST